MVDIFFALATLETTRFLCVAHVMMILYLYSTSLETPFKDYMEKRDE